MEHKRDLAIVLRSIAFEERHRIITAITENHGIISALARNAIQSRRFGGSLEPFAASEWQFAVKPGTELCRLEEATIKRPYEGLRKDFEKLSMASAFNELLLKVAPQHESCADLFKLHSNALATLEEMSTEGFAAGDGYKLLNGFLAKLLQWSGNQPQLHRCLRCEVELHTLDLATHVSCIVVDAGWICPSCRSAGTRHVREREQQAFGDTFLRLSPTAIHDFQLSLSIPIRLMPTQALAGKAEHQELFRFLEALFVFHIPGFDQKPLKSLRFLDLESNVRLPGASFR